MGPPTLGMSLQLKRQRWPESTFKMELWNLLLGSEGSEEGIIISNKVLLGLDILRVEYSKG